MPPPRHACLLCRLLDDTRYARSAPLLIFAAASLQTRCCYYHAILMPFSQLYLFAAAMPLSCRLMLLAIRHDEALPLRDILFLPPFDIHTCRCCLLCRSFFAMPRAAPCRHDLRWLPQHATCYAATMPFMICHALLMMPCYADADLLMFSSHTPRHSCLFSLLPATLFHTPTRCRDIFAPAIYAPVTIRRQRAADAAA